MAYEVIALDKYQEDLRSILIYLVDILDAPSAAASIHVPRKAKLRSACVVVYAKGHLA